MKKIPINFTYYRSEAHYIDEFLCNPNGSYISTHILFIWQKDTFFEKITKVFKLLTDKYIIRRKLK